MLITPVSPLIHSFWATCPVYIQPCVTEMVDVAMHDRSQVVDTCDMIP